MILGNGSENPAEMAYSRTLTSIEPGGMTISCWVPHYCLFSPLRHKNRLREMARKLLSQILGSYRQAIELRAIEGVLRLE